MNKKQKLHNEAQNQKYTP